MSEAIHMSDLPSKSQEVLPRKIRAVRMQDMPSNEARRTPSEMPNRKVGEILKDGAWKGERCFIIAGGKSVNNFDLQKLKYEHVIGVNLAFRLLDPEIHYSVDARLWGWIESGDTGPGDREKFEKSKAIKVWSDLARSPLPEELFLAPSIGRQGLSHAFSEGIGPGTNSGFGALNIALLLGASEIYLIGYDFYGTRWHDGYPQKGEMEPSYHRVCYEEASEEFKTFPSRIINLNPASHLKIFEFGEMPKDLRTEPRKPEVVERKKLKNEPMFVCYYTPDNGYKPYAADLMASLDRFQLDYDVQPIKNRGNWDKNTKAKPDFILKMMDRYPERDIVWLDADSVVLSLPEILLKLGNKPVDCACHVRKGRELISSVMFFKNNSKCRKVLTEVKELIAVEGERLHGEQKFFEEVIMKHKKRTTFKFQTLPEEYCDMLLISNSQGPTVIEQRQASRKLKT